MMTYLAKLFLAVFLSTATIQAQSVKPKVPCESCHTEISWSQAKFNHNKTNFPLKGKHTTIKCEKCHPNNEYSKIQDRTCGNCHKDVHAGQMGQRCEKCHMETTWKGTFTAEGHRRTNFPLTGRHAVIPCEECHMETRERNFSRATLACFDCHAKDYQSTAATPVNHPTLGFSTNCRECHHPSFFKPARFTTHDPCFVVTRGPHAKFTCTDCHKTGITTTVASCGMTNTATCTGCHTGAHSQSKMNQTHSGINGYQYNDQKCYDCHKAIGD